MVSGDADSEVFAPHPLYELLSGERRAGRGGGRARPAHAPAGGHSRRSAEADAIELFPYAIFVVDANGQVVYRNAEAARLLAGTPLDEPGLACCELLGCRRGEGLLADACLTELATSQQQALPEVRVELCTAEGEQTLWVTAAPLGDGEGGAVLQLRPDDVAGDRRADVESQSHTPPALRIATMGETVVESADGAILGGDWLGYLPGQLLKYLVATRDRMVTVDEIGEALWREAGYAVAPKVRYYVHALRRTIEPERGPHARSSLIISRAGCYRLDPDRVQIDISEFEARIGAGLSLARAEPRAAVDELTRALVLYRGDFLSDLPNAEWALAERDRLHDLACVALQALADLSLERGDRDDAIRHLAKLALQRPYDEDLHLQLMRLDVQRGRLTDAMRRYEALHARMIRVFGRGPRFTAADLAKLASE
jgi:DNA-binding SARP family transcriptional activator